MRFLLPFTLLLTAALPVRAEPVLVFAAASLKTALDQVAEDYRRETGRKVAISYAGSGQLARQIIAGAPADLFISANSQWMDEVEQAGRVVNGGRKDLLGNRLVLIAAGETAPVSLGPDSDLVARLGSGKLAMALVEAVPAGQYGMAAFRHLGLWQDIAPNVAQTDNVRAALALVATGAAPFGVVYATDATAEPDVTVVARFPEDSHPPITYPAALLDARGEDFFRALFAKPAAARFAAQGFAVLD